MAWQSMLAHDQDLVTAGPAYALWRRCGWVVGRRWGPRPPAKCVGAAALSNVAPDVFQRPPRPSGALDCLPLHSRKSLTASNPKVQPRAIALRDRHSPSPHGHSR